MWQVNVQLRSKRVIRMCVCRMMIASRDCQFGFPLKQCGALAKECLRKKSITKERLYRLLGALGFRNLKTVWWIKSFDSDANTTISKQLGWASDHAISMQTHESCWKMKMWFGKSSLNSSVIRKTQCEKGRVLSYAYSLFNKNLIPPIIQKKLMGRAAI